MDFTLWLTAITMSNRNNKIRPFINWCKDRPAGRTIRNATKFPAILINCERFSRISGKYCTSANETDFTGRKIESL